MDIQEEFEIYGGFAGVYDLFMDDIPYDEWFDYLMHLLGREGITDGLVVDLACGTGEITKRLRREGFQTTGVDLSQEMLEIASQKCPPDVLLLHQDMRELQLFERAQAVVCLCDSMNYILSEQDLAHVFSRVCDSLTQGGIFVFDMKTEYFYREVLGECTLADNRENASYIWENEYDEESGINTYLLTIYELVDNDRDLFVRTDELHRQRGYPAERVRKLLVKCGFTVTGLYGELSEKAPASDSERIYFVAIKENSYE